MERLAALLVVVLVGALGVAYRVSFWAARGWVVEPVGPPSARGPGLHPSNGWHG
jgi:hypothetical protein